ncbi:unnamed protein product [Phytomonas sp. Hart1]|nr:unnamed protein product [Phytomonas sp. Hart1]|eukprot:CCW71717.1 unnamed protein product [Phytomonas sp. isolate Hart1]
MLGFRPSSKSSAFFFLGGNDVEYRPKGDRPNNKASTHAYHSDISFTYLRTSSENHSRSCLLFLHDHLSLYFEYVEKKYIHLHVYSASVIAQCFVILSCLVLYCNEE